MHKILREIEETHSSLLFTNIDATFPERLLRQIEELNREELNHEDTVVLVEDIMQFFLSDKRDIGIENEELEEKYRELEKEQEESLEKFETESDTYKKEITSLKGKLERRDKKIEKLKKEIEQLKQKTGDEKMK